MACLPDEKILAYSEDELSPIEAAQVRDHLLLCPACRNQVERYRKLERALLQPVLSEPPARLIPQVLQGLYPALPRYTSIAAMIAASTVFLFTWIYVYFDFSRNSLVQALRLTTKGTSGWLSDIIKAISAVYNGAQGAMKAGRALLRIFLPAPLETAVIAIVFLSVTGLLGLYFIRPWLNKARTKRS